MTIDPRLIDRRREVAEDRARKNVRRLIRFLVALAIVGGLIWLMLSPLLSVKEVITTGIASSSAHAALVEEEVLAGRPMILIRPGEIVAALQDDPWVRQAAVELDWPNRVLVRVEERVPVGWVETGDGWSRRAVDGVALPSSTEPDPSMVWAHFPELPESEAGESRQVIGALEFAETLPTELRSGAQVAVAGNGEMWAEVSGFRVRLGRPIEMRAKALSLSALLAESPPPGSTLNLIAPTHPAITPPISDRKTPEEEP